MSTSQSTASNNPSAITAENNVFISATYINVNGLIQSGVDSYSLTLDSSLNSSIASYDSSIKETVDDGSRFTLSDGLDSGSIKAEYNPFTNNIEIEDVEVRGGYIELRGKILSTDNGRIYAMDGYGDINITNNTDYALELGNLNTGDDGIEGQIVIVDRLKDSTSEYTRDDNGDILINGSLHQSNSRTTTYTPGDVTYQYVNYGSEYTYNLSRRDVENGDYFSGDQFTLVGEDSEESNYSTVLEGTAASSEYRFDATSSRAGSRSLWWFNGNNGNVEELQLSPYDGTDYFISLQEYYNHYFKANHVIDVEFIGSDAGTVNVVSNAGIYLGFAEKVSPKFMPLLTKNFLTNQ
ncbi:hypothetical protein WH8501_17110 [Crocosphaera watsonii WH 8501]|uniref:Uncharacterized protein n=1 Tax=Crocosphaera watsonii WH 8501 TaxID=165597 RepID=Q4BUX5_CROWT|nr:hypothetical protein [Crocosphaera watsonii]EAM47705.1 hypothetical protein CwatDRAFT_0378 [Crocosphaera watsonii WH 8501]